MKAKCPKDCPKRSYDPNCHNVETCEIYAEMCKTYAIIRKNRQKERALDGFSNCHLGYYRK